MKLLYIIFSLLLRIGNFTEILDILAYHSYGDYLLKKCTKIKYLEFPSSFMIASSTF